jgi:hypothetical protein
MNKKYYNNNNNSSGGIGILGVLQIIFIVLKCLDLVDWTWTQVFIPTFIGGALLAIAIVVLFIILWRENK